MNVLSIGTNQHITQDLKFNCFILDGSSYGCLSRK